MTSPETRDQLARACDLFESLDCTQRQGLPEHWTAEAVRLRDLHEFAVGRVPAAASCRRSDRPFREAAVVMLIRDEGDIIHSHLRWHYRLGLRNFVILNNRSADDTLERIGRFQADCSDAEVHVIDDPVIGYYQSSKTTAAATIARDRFGVDWVIPLDADEVLTVHGTELGVTLASLAQAGKDYVMVHRCDYCISSEDDPGQPDPLMRLRFRQPYLTPTPKVFVRFRDGMTIEGGNHWASTGDGRRLAGVSGLQHGMMLRHFPLRSRDQIRRKIINGGEALAAAPDLDAKFGDFWRSSIAIYQREGESFIDRYPQWFYQCESLSPERLVYDPLL